MESDNIPFARVSQFEQVQTDTENYATLTATYYTTLLTKGVPSEVAKELTRDWHYLFWLSKFNSYITTEGFPEE